MTPGPSVGRIGLGLGVSDTVPELLAVADCDDDADCDALSVPLLDRDWLRVSEVLFVTEKHCVFQLDFQCG